MIGNKSFGEVTYKGKLFFVEPSFHSVEIKPLETFGDGSRKSPVCFVDRGLFDILEERGLVGKLAYWNNEIYGRAHKNTRYDSLEAVGNETVDRQWADFFASAVETMESTGDDKDFLFAFGMSGISHIFHGFSTISFSDFVDMWNDNKAKLGTFTRYDTDGIPNLRHVVERVIKHEYGLIGHEQGASFSLIGSDDYLLDYDKETFDARIRVYQEVVRRSPNEKKIQGKDAWIWRNSPARTSRILLKTAGDNVSIPLAEKLLAGDDATRFAACAMGSHVTKKAKYLSEILKTLDLFDTMKKKSGITRAVDIVHNSTGTTRLFSDDFLAVLVGADIKAEDQANDEAADIVSRMREVREPSGTLKGILHQSSRYPSMKFAPVPADINYLVSLLVTYLGAYEGLGVLLDAVEHDFSQSKVPTVAQWERYAKNYENFRGIPFEVGIQLATFRRN